MPGQPRQSPRSGTNPRSAFHARWHSFASTAPLLLLLRLSGKPVRKSVRHLVADNIPSVAHHEPVSLVSDLASGTTSYVLAMVSLGVLALVGLGAAIRL